MGAQGARVNDDARLAVRRALRAALADLDDSAPVLVACSGGADSLALALAAADERRSSNRPTSAVIIDHGLQDDSADVARTAADACARAGLDPVEVIRVDVARGPGSGGLESAARDARRSALTDAAQRLHCSAILLAHTRDDQAETVLLRLARGSGARSLSAMAPVEGPWRRPLLDLPRSVVRASLGDHSAWDDPHNADPAFARVRVRHEALPALVDALGPDVVDGLARSARLLRDDADALDDLADNALAHLRIEVDGDTAFEIHELESLPRAVRTRLLRQAAVQAGVPANDLTLSHIDRVEALISDWHGQGAVDLPAHVGAWRSYGRLTLGRVDSVSERRNRTAPRAPEE